MRQYQVTLGVLALAGAVTGMAFLPFLGVSVPGFLFLAATAVAAWAWLGRRAGHTHATRSPWFTGTGLVLGALLLRMPALVSTPWLSDDIHRYLWEGRVQRAGQSPYALAPDAVELQALRNETWEHVNHKDVSAAYPPAAQFLFRVLPESILCFKATVLAADLLILAVLLAWLKRRGRPPGAAAWYAFHPLVILEFAGSGHLDALALAPLVVALALASHARGAWTGLATAVGALCKPPALVGALALARRRNLPGVLVLAVAAVLLWWPFRADGADLLQGLGEYRERWEFNGFLFPWLRTSLEQAKTWLEARPAEVGAWDLWRELGYRLEPGPHARRICEVLFLLLAIPSAWRFRDRPWHGVGRILCVQILTMPTVHPWYVCWLVPFLVTRWVTATAVLTGTILVASVAKVGEWVHGEWNEPPWMWWAVWLPPLLVWLGQTLRRERAAP